MPQASDYPSFSSDKINQALESAQRHSKAHMPTDISHASMAFVDGTLKTRAECISVTINNGQACLNLPVVGSECIAVPSWIPNGTAAQACLDICTKWGIPCGVQVTLSVAGQQIVQKGFGCSC